MLKEQELAGATSMFSQTRSLQALIQQVQNSTTEVELQLDAGFSRILLCMEYFVFLVVCWYEEIGIIPHKY